MICFYHKNSLIILIASPLLYDVAEHPTFPLYLFYSSLDSVTKGVIIKIISQLQWKEFYSFNKNNFTGSRELSPNFSKTPHILICLLLFLIFTCYLTLGKYLTAYIRMLVLIIINIYCYCNNSIFMIVYCYTYLL